MGVRLVRIASVRAYIEGEAVKYAKAAKEFKGTSPVAAKGREVMAANRARRKAQRETAAA
jgi:hypothetical protein